MSGWAIKEPTKIYGTNGGSLNNSGSLTSTPAKSPGGGGGWNNSTPRSVYATSPSSNNTSDNTQAQINDTRDITEVTKRMKKLAVESDEMANETLKGLEMQNETIKKQQDEVANMADDLNVADRKLRGIRSFFSHLGNQFRKDNSGEHQKSRQKYEKEMAKTSFKTEAERMKNEEQEHETKFTEWQEKQKLQQDRDAQQLHQAKLQSQKDYKAMKKGNEAPGDTVFMGKFNFQVNAVPGEQCEAENDLDEIGQHVKGLKQKAEAMKGYVEESDKRIADLHTDLRSVQDRTVVATKKGEKIIKNDSFF
jgi:hypothetical protein